MWSGTRNPTRVLGQAPGLSPRPPPTLDPVDTVSSSKRWVSSDGIKFVIVEIVNKFGLKLNSTQFSSSSETRTSNVQWRLNRHCKSSLYENKTKPKTRIVSNLSFFRVVGVWFPNTVEERAPLRPRVQRVSFAKETLHCAPGPFTV